MPVYNAKLKINAGGHLIEIIWYLYLNLKNWGVLNARVYSMESIFGGVLPSYLNPNPVLDQQQHFPYLHVHV